MSALKQLKDISNEFEKQLKNISNELFCAKVGETFEDGIAKKMQDLSFLTSKLRLLKAVPTSPLPLNENEQPHLDSTIKEYGDVAMWKVLEQAIVKSLTQAHAVKSLITTADQNLNPEMVERKENIILSLKEYRQQEYLLRHLDTLQKEKEEEIAAVRQEWDVELTKLRQMQEESSQFENCEISGPLYTKLRTMVDKLEMMRWLICRLVTSRGCCDWLAAPSRTARALRLARTLNTVDSFVDDD